MEYVGLQYNTVILFVVALNLSGNLILLILLVLFLFSSLLRSLASLYLILSFLYAPTPLPPSLIHFSPLSSPSILHVVHPTIIHSPLHSFVSIQQRSW